MLNGRQVRLEAQLEREVMLKAMFCPLAQGDMTPTNQWTTLVRYTGCLGKDSGHVIVYLVFKSSTLEDEFLFGYNCGVEIT